MTAKAINASVQGLQGAIIAFQKGVVNPLATQVSNFSQAIGKFNRSHQEFLKEQVGGMENKLDAIINLLNKPEK